MSDILKLAGDQIETKYQQCEQLLREIHESGGRLTYDAFLQCESALGWDKKKTKSEFHRLGRVIRAEQIAADKNERAKLDANIAAAENELATTGAEIEARIAEDQRQLRALKAKCDSLSRQRDQANGAVSTLMDDRQLPDHIVMAHSNRRGTLNETIRSELNALKVDRDQITQLLTLTGAELVKTIEHYDRSLLTRHERGWLVPTDAWPEHRAELQRQLPMLEAEIEKLEAEYQAEAEKLETLKGYYIK